MGLPGEFLRESNRLLSCGEDRFYTCGGCGFVRRGVYRCDLLPCGRCAARRSERLRSLWTPAVERVPPRHGYRWALLTLTIRRTDSLRACVDRILTAWRLLRTRIVRRYKTDKRHFGGFASVEVAGAVHLHALVHMPFVPQAWLSKVWKQLTRDSFVVDVRQIHGGTRVAAAYVTKYVVKTVDPALGVRVWLAVRGRQIHRAFGVCVGLVEKPARPPCHCRLCGGVDWQPTAAFFSLYALAKGARPVVASAYG